MPDTPLCLVMGMDSFDSLPAWHRWRELIELAHIVVVPRPDQGRLRAATARFLEARQVGDASDLKTRLAGCIYRCEITALAISATDIRERLSAGRSIRYLVPEPVWRDLQSSK
jgi:nicotinate-nucleotide adenylyltransferase